MIERKYVNLDSCYNIPAYSIQADKIVSHYLYFLVVPRVSMQENISCRLNLNVLLS